MDNFVESFIEENEEFVTKMTKDSFFRAKVLRLADNQPNRITLRLQDFTLKDGLEEVVIWGITPLKRLVMVLDEVCIRRDEPEDLIFLRYQIGTQIEDLQDCLYRLDEELSKDWQKKPESEPAKASATA